MKLSELNVVLSENANALVRFVLPTGSKIPLHAHVTEVARIDKRFVDCGGTLRNESTCRLQTWFSDDTEHRLTGRVLQKILSKAGSFLGSDDLEIDVEHEAPFISQFPLFEARPSANGIELILGAKHTACLAEDACMAPPAKRTTDLSKLLPSLAPSKCCG